MKLSDKWLQDKLHSSKNYVEPYDMYSYIELFAGGGLSHLGHWLSGFQPIMVNEFDKTALKIIKDNYTISQDKVDADTLKPTFDQDGNRIKEEYIPFECIQDDVRKVDFTKYKDEVDVIFGSPPCQAFSSAGKKQGLSDPRGILIFEFLRALNEARPKMAVMENVSNLAHLENGKILEYIKETSDKIGYNILASEILNAVDYRVPQKRKRIFIVFGRKDLNIKYTFPQKYDEVYTLRDALEKGRLYGEDVEKTNNYPPFNDFKASVMSQVPEGGWWKHLPDDVARAYCKGGYNPEKRGSTGLARRLSFDKPCPTLLTSPSQKLTEFCHPKENRDLTVEEYKRVMTLPDSYKIDCSRNQAYKIIGNGIPTLLSMEIGLSVIKSLNELSGFNYLEWVAKNYID